jgi:hypothetical protein
MLPMKKFRSYVQNFFHPQVFPTFRAGLPDAIFFAIWVHFGSAMEWKKVVILFRHLIHFRPFGNLVAIWYIFSPFLYIVSRKIWQPCLEETLDGSPQN